MLFTRVDYTQTHRQARPSTSSAAAVCSSRDHDDEALTTIRKNFHPTFSRFVYNVTHAENDDVYL